MNKERTELGVGVTWIKDEALRRWRIEAVDIQKLIAAWGPRDKELFIGLSKALVAVDQLVSLHDLMLLNDQLPEGSLRRERNLMTRRRRCTWTRNQPQRSPTRPAHTASARLATPSTIA